MTHLFVHVARARIITFVFLSHIHISMCPGAGKHEDTPCLWCVFLELHHKQGMSSCRLVCVSSCQEFVEYQEFVECRRVFLELHNKQGMSSCRLVCVSSRQEFVEYGHVFQGVSLVWGSWNMATSSRVCLFVWVSRIRIWRSDGELHESCHTHE